MRAREIIQCDYIMVVLYDALAVDDGSTSSCITDSVEAGCRIPEVGSTAAV